MKLGLLKLLTVTQIDTNIHGKFIRYIAKVTSMENNYKLPNTLKPRGPKHFTFDNNLTHIEI